MRSSSSRLDEFFRVGVDVDRVSQPLQTLDPLEKVCYVVDVPVAQLTEDFSGLRIESIG